MDTEKKVLEIIRKIKNNNDLDINMSTQLTKNPFNFVAIDFVYLYLLIFKEFGIKLDQDLLCTDKFSTAEKIIKTIEKKRESQD